MTKATHRALLSSVAALIVCLTMLIGTTFAWFTDTASTAVNTIKSGTLDVKLEVAIAWDSDGKPTEWKDAKDEVLQVRTADGRTDSILWEPGCTYYLPEIRVVNDGNLALKYKIYITGITGDIKLNEVIEWNTDDITADEGHLMPNETSEAITIGGHMKETAGNEYMGLSIEGMAITVYAIQDTVEYDSTTNQYDDVDFPIFLVNGVDILSAHENTVSCGEGTAVYDFETNTLTLTGATIDSYYTSDDIYAAIYAKNIPLNIVLEGENKIDIQFDSFSSGRALYGIYGDDIEPINISGTGTLDINLNHNRIARAIYNVGDVNISNATVGVSTDANSTETVIDSEEGDICIDNATVTSAAAQAGFCAENGDIDIKNGSNVTLNCENKAIHAECGSININGSEVSAKSENDIAIYAQDNSITIKDSTVTAENSIDNDDANDNDNGYAVYAFGKITIDHSTVNAKACTGWSAIYSYVENYDEEAPEYSAGIELKNAHIASGQTLNNSGWQWWDDGECWWNEGYFENPSRENITISPN